MAKKPKRAGPARQPIRANAGGAFRVDAAGGVADETPSRRADRAASPAAPDAQTAPETEDSR